MANPCVTIALADASYLLGLIDTIEDRAEEEHQAVEALRTAIEEMTA